MTAHPTDAFLALAALLAGGRGRSPSAASSTAAAPPNSRHEVVAAYDAPFPDDTYKAGARSFPTLVPTSPDDPAADANRAAWEVLGRWDKPLLTAFSDGDPITRGGERPFQKLVPGAPGADRTRPSRAAATSCRRTRAPSWRP